MGRKILCEACGSVLNEDILKAKNSMNTCLVCGASLDGSDGSQTVPEEELITWYYIEFENSDSYFIVEESKFKKEKMSSDMEIKYIFQAPSRDKNGKSDAAKEVLRREYKPDAFMPNPSKVTKPDALWIAEGKCPRCHSDNIQLIQRKWSIWTGFRTSKVDRVCVNCKYKF